MVLQSFLSSVDFQFPFTQVPLAGHTLLESLKIVIAITTNTENPQHYIMHPRCFVFRFRRFEFPSSVSYCISSAEIV